MTTTDQHTDEDEEICSFCGSGGPGWDTTCPLCGHKADHSKCNECREPLGEHAGPYHPWCDS